MPDLAISNSSSNNIGVALGNGDGTFRVTTALPVGSSPRRMIAVDLRGIGTLDLAVVNFNSNSLSVLLGDGDGAFQPAQTTTGFSSPTSVATADFNLDGKADLAVTNSSSASTTVTVLLRSGDATCQPPKRL